MDCLAVLSDEQNGRFLIYYERHHDMVGNSQADDFLDGNRQAFSLHTEYITLLADHDKEIFLACKCQAIGFIRREFYACADIALPKVRGKVCSLHLLHKPTPAGLDGGLLQRHLGGWLRWE